MCKEFRGQGVGEAQEESLRCPGKACGLQPMGEEESWSLLRGRMGQISTDRNVTAEAAAWVLLPHIQGFK